MFLQGLLVIFFNHLFDDDDDDVSNLQYFSLAFGCIY